MSATCYLLFLPHLVISHLIILSRTPSLTRSPYTHLILSYLLCQPKRSLPCQSKPNLSLLPSAFYAHLTVISHLVLSTLALISYFPHTLISYSLILYSLISYSYIFLSFTSPPLATISCSSVLSVPRPNLFHPVPNTNLSSHTLPYLISHYHHSPSLTLIRVHFISSYLTYISFSPLCLFTLTCHTLHLMP